MFLIGGGLLFYNMEKLDLPHIFATGLFFLAGGILEWQSYQSSRDEHADDMGLVRVNYNHFTANNCMLS
ncbi:MAG: hypothetical protein O3C48_05370 [Crenarchaeota archaeon]|nr:hypothetical protein [Thermoproteota archaeon]